MTARWFDPHRLPACCDPGYARALASGLTPGVVRIRTSAEARGQAAAIDGELRVKVRKTGRGERDSPATNDLLVMRLAEPPEPCEWLRSA